MDKTDSKFHRTDRKRVTLLKRELSISLAVTLQRPALLLIHKSGKQALGCPGDITT